ncbi:MULTISPECIES: alpha-amylase [Eubacteriales]|uniref:alpha-amylase n=1 Tax=Eubacteriales TaxID=186802 RepID=UPI00041E7005|nr:MULTISPECIES: alpha-amylase [Eubacteriales]
MKNPTAMQYFEWYLPADGQLWRQAEAKAARLAADGVTALWLPPAYKGAAGKEDVGYGVYDLYDLGEFDQRGTVATKYGTKAEYLAAIKALQREGIAVWADAVLDHRMGADGTEQVPATPYDWVDRYRQTGPARTISAWTSFTFPGRGGRYSDFCWNWEHFDGIDWDDATGEKAIFKFQGKEWDSEVDSENGNYDYLMGADVDLGNPQVVEELTRWGLWYLNETGVDGFRIDAAKHIRFTFFRDWLHALRRLTGKPVFAVGEYWNQSADALCHYIGVTGGSLSLFDVPLHQQFCQASHSGGGVRHGLPGAKRPGAAGAPVGGHLCGQPRHPAWSGAGILGGRVVQTPGLRLHPPAQRGAALCLLRRLLRHPPRRDRPGGPAPLRPPLGPADLRLGPPDRRL